MTTTTTPIRVQRKRTRGWKMPPHTKSVTRPGKFGNPIKIKRDGNLWRVLRDGDTVELCFTRDQAQQQAVNYFDAYLDTLPPSELDALLAELCGWNLACFCPLDSPCHSDVWLRRANKDQS